MRIAKDRCRRRLAALWFTAAGIIIGIILLQTFFGVYGDDLETVWGWILPTILPTLSLIIGVLVSDALEKGKKNDMLDPFLFRLSFGISSAYLMVVLLTILIQPVAALPPPELMRQSHLWLAPFQGLVSACLGAFFIRREEAK